MSMLDLDLDQFQRSLPELGVALRMAEERQHSLADDDGEARPRVLAIGGSTRPGSFAEQTLRIAADAAAEHGADVQLLAGRDLLLPIYDTETSWRSPRARRLITRVHEADGILVASPGYHGGLSGMVKNALDYLEDLRDDDRPYLHRRAMGCIAVAYGWQAAVTTLQQLRQVGHALRAWPTPQGCAANAALGALGDPDQQGTVGQLRLIGQQVVEFAMMSRHAQQDGSARNG